MIPNYFITFPNIKKTILFNVCFLLAIFLSTTYCFAKATNACQPILEIVIFQVKPHINDKTVINTAQNTNAFLHSMPGFAGRFLSKTKKKRFWIDIIKWKSLKQALNAARLSFNKTSMQHFVSLMSHYKMYHFSDCNLIKQKVFQLRNNN